MARPFEAYELCGAWWEAEARTLYDDQWLYHRGRDIRVLLEAKAELQTANVDIRAVELGSHRASFLRGVAAEHAPEHVLGVEYRQKYHRLAKEAVSGDPNEERIHLVRADAKLAIPILFEPNSLDAVYVTFPDPWWKSRHADRRLLDPAFMRIIARRLKKGGRLYLKSDVFDYLYRVRHYAELSGALRPLPSDLWPDEKRWSLTTRERKCRQDAIPFGRGYYQRARDFDSTLPTSPEEWEREQWDVEISGNEIIRGAPPLDKKTTAMTLASIRKASDRQNTSSE